MVATADWEKRIAEVTWSPPRKNWKTDVARMLQNVWPPELLPNYLGLQVLGAVPEGLAEE